MASGELRVIFFLCLPDKERSKESAPRANAPPLAPSPPWRAGPPASCYTRRMIDDLKSQFERCGEISFSVKVRPSAGKTLLKGVLDDGTMKIDIAAVPEDGKANAELIRFLSEEFNVTKNHVTIIKGETSPRKTVRITGKGK